MKYHIKQEGKFKYFEKGDGHTIILLHGLFGALSNFEKVIDFFSQKLKVYVPLLPLFEHSPEESTLIHLKNYVDDFIRYKKLNETIIVGNSLGGHVALLYALENFNNNKVKALILTGSSGLFENTLGESYPRKGDYDFVKEKIEFTFYKPETATKKLVDEVYEIVNNRDKVLNIVSYAKSALRSNVSSQLNLLKIPVLLIWGKNDPITPPFVGEKFKQNVPQSNLFIIEECGHAPMMEKPEEFNQLLYNFLIQIDVIEA